MALLTDQYYGLTPPAPYTPQNVYDIANLEGAHLWSLGERERELQSLHAPVYGSQAQSTAQGYGWEGPSVIKQGDDTFYLRGFNEDGTPRYSSPSTGRALTSSAWEEIASRNNWDYKPANSEPQYSWTPNEQFSQALAQAMGTTQPNARDVNGSVLANLTQQRINEFQPAPSSAPGIINSPGMLLGGTQGIDSRPGIIPTPSQLGGLRPTLTPLQQAIQSGNVSDEALGKVWAALPMEERIRLFQPQGDRLSNETNDAVAQSFYNWVKEDPGNYDKLSPQEKMQYQYLRYVNGEISGNNKDDQIKKIRQEYNLPKEQMDGEHRYIVRNKPLQPDRKDGITPGDAFAIGAYTQTDTGKDKGMFESFINKSLPGFDVQDVLDIPFIDELAMLTALPTGGLSTAGLEALKLSAGKDFGLDSLLNFAGLSGGATGMLGVGGSEISPYVDASLGQLANTTKDTSWNDTPKIPDTVDPNEIYTPPTQEETVGILDDNLGDIITVIDNILRDENTDLPDWDWEPPSSGGGGGGDAGAGDTGGTPGDDEVGRSERPPTEGEDEDRWTWNGSVLVNTSTGETREIPNPGRMEEGVIYNGDGEVVGKEPESESIILSPWWDITDIFGDSTRDGGIDGIEGTGGTGTTGDGSTTDGTGGNTGTDNTGTGETTGGTGGGSGDGTGTGGGDGTGDGTGDGSGDGDGNGTDLNTITSVASGLLSTGTPAEWRDFMATIEAEFPILKRLKITPQEFIRKLLAGKMA